MRHFDRWLLEDGRQRLCARARGDTLEVAVGSGLNLAHYPSSVRLTGIDLSPAMLALAAARARELHHEVDLRLGDAQALAFPDACFETVVFALALCTIADERRGAAAAPIADPLQATAEVLRVVALILANALQVIAVWWFHRQRRAASHRTGVAR